MRRLRSVVKRVRSRLNSLVEAFEYFFETDFWKYVAFFMLLLIIGLVSAQIAIYETKKRMPLYQQLLEAQAVAASQCELALNANLRNIMAWEEFRDAVENRAFLESGTNPTAKESDYGREKTTD